MNWAILGTIIGLIVLSLTGFIALATIMIGMQKNMIDMQKNIGILLGRTEHLQPTLTDHGDRISRLESMPSTPPATSEDAKASAETETSAAKSSSHQLAAASR